jgi:hypothetical protein
MENEEKGQPAIMPLEKIESSDDTHSLSKEVSYDRKNVGDGVREKAAQLAMKDPAIVKRMNFKTFEVDLPSGGDIYPDDHPIRKTGGKVLVRQMTASDEDILNNRQLIKNKMAIDTLLTRCVVEPQDLDINTLVPGDKSIITVVIRINGIGEEYIVNMRCPKCNNPSESETYHLNSVQIKRVNEENVAQQTGNNKFKFRLKMSAKDCEIKLLNGHEEREIERIIEDSKRKRLPIEETTTRLLFMIESLDGETEKGKIREMLNSLTAGDSKQIRQIYDKIAPDVMMIHKEWMCPNPDCMEISDVVVPIDTGFFWPELV